MSHSPSPRPSSTEPSSRHAASAVEKQRSQLDRLLKDPSKPAYIPAPPKDKSIRPPREMMKNVQGSSAGAGSGEFHVYKAGRRREYERLKAMDETAKAEQIAAEFAERKRQREEEAESKTAKNRAKRQKKKERGKGKVDGEGSAHTEGHLDSASGTSAAPLKKRRLVNGEELVFKRPTEDDDEQDQAVDTSAPKQLDVSSQQSGSVFQEMPVSTTAAPRIIIHEDD